MSINYDYIFDRWRSFWDMENEDRPIISLSAPKKNADPLYPKVPDSIKDAWLDAEYKTKWFRAYFESLDYFAECYPRYNPNLGPDFMGAMCGCDLRFSPTTSWAENCIDDYETFPRIRFDENNIWWKKMCELTQAALDDSRGDYIVGITDLHPGADTVVSLRGAEEAAMDLYLEPDNFKKRVWEIFSVFQEVAARQYEMISKTQKASTNWMGILHPDKLWYVTSCDFSYMISHEHFEEFILPEIKAECDWLPATIYHLDGIGSLKHLDSLLQIKNLHGIQWVPGEGKGTAKEWIDVYKKVQRAGKRLEISCVPEDIVPLCEALDPQGVHFDMCVPDRDSAEAIIKDVERIYRQKRGVFAVSSPQIK